MIPLLIALASAADPMAGAVVRPFSRADLVWVEENRTSGEGVSEFDGVVVPVVQPFVGAWFGRVGWLGSLGVARISTSTYVGDTISRRQQTVVRPSTEVRYAFRTASPRLWSAASFHVTIPSASDRSNAYTDEEQDAADVSSRNTRARLGGAGGAIGVGAELDPGLGTEGTRTEIAEAVLDRQLDAEVGRGRRHQLEVQAAMGRCLGKAGPGREAE